MAKKENEAIRRAARVAGIPLWMIAAEVGVSEPTLLRWLRFPLSEEKEHRVMAAIAHLAKEVEQNG
ncbi:hypothetical protein AALA54_16345 [Oscillospiraceae bacterium 44-34]